MPASVHRPKVARCVQHVMDKGSAVPICQASIGESYRIGKAERAVAKKGGKALKQLRKQQAETKAAKIQARREKMGWNTAADLIETFNGFCPTGKGGGRDNSCHGAGGRLNSKADERRRKLRRLFERAKAEVMKIVKPPKPLNLSVGKWGGRAHGMQVNEILAILNGDNEVQTSIAKVKAGAVGGTTALLEHCKKSAKRRKRK